MANGHGGARQPANPAPVSGPGVFARRTDGKQPILNLPDAKYGENAQFRQAQAASPIPQTSGTPMAPGGPPDASQSPLGGPGSPPLNPPPPLGSGSLLPNTPVTDGAAAGAGAGPEALHLQSPVQNQHASALSMVQALAQQPAASPAIRFLADSLSGRF